MIIWFIFKKERSSNSSRQLNNRAFLLNIRKSVEKFSEDYNNEQTRNMVFYSKVLFLTELFFEYFGKHNNVDACVKNEFGVDKMSQYEDFFDVFLSQTCGVNCSRFEYLSKDMLATMQETLANLVKQHPSERSLCTVKGKLRVIEDDQEISFQFKDYMKPCAAEVKSTPSFYNENDIIPYARCMYDLDFEKLLRNKKDLNDFKEFLTNGSIKDNRYVLHQLKDALAYYFSSKIHSGPCGFDTAHLDFLELYDICNTIHKNIEKIKEMEARGRTMFFGENSKEKGQEK